MRIWCLFTFYQLADEWCKFSNSAAKVIMLRDIKQAGYKKIYLFRYVS